MDDRIREHASILVDWSARVDPGDNVIVSVAEGAHDLGVAVAEALGERGASMVANYDSAELSRAYLQATDEDNGDLAVEETPSHERALWSIHSSEPTRRTTSW